MATLVSSPSSPIVTIVRIAALLIAVVVGVFLVGLLPPFTTSLAYIVFVLATIMVVRSVPVEPGAWLGLRVVRRALVVLISLITVDFLTSGSSYQATEFPLLGALALADFALGRATRRIASAEARDLDERQESLRNRAHRIVERGDIFHAASDPFDPLRIEAQPIQQRAAELRGGRRGHISGIGFEDFGLAGANCRSRTRQRLILRPG